MGANATTFVPAYVAGEVLTAADLSVTNSGIPVFADSTARTAAFGGTGEKVLAEGQYAYLESDNSTSVYDGSNWVAVGASGLVLVKSETVGSAVASVTVSNAFNATYNAYKIIATDVAASGNGILQFAFTGLTTGYYGSLIYASFAAGSVGGLGFNNVSSWTYSGGMDSAKLYCSIECIDPFLAKPTSFVAQFTDNNNSGSMVGKQTSNTSATGFTITPSTGTITGGTIKVYGYANS
jgi:hypothetical protein